MALPFSTVARVNVTAWLLSTSSICVSCAASMVARSLRVICNARSSPNTFGSANSNENSRTIATSQYFQRA